MNNLFYNIKEKNDNINNYTIYFNNEKLDYQLYFLRNIVFGKHIFLKKNQIINKNSLNNIDLNDIDLNDNESICFICFKIIFLVIIVVVAIFIVKKFRK